MTWKRIGLVCEPSQDYHRFGGWMSYPTPLQLDDRVRVFYSPRNKDNQSIVSFVDLDPDDLTRVLNRHDRPVLERGALGTFDDCGVQPMQAISVGEEVWLYYLGWNPAANRVSRNSTGLAVSRDGGLSFDRAFQGPVLDRTRDEPYFSFTPWVLRDGDGWKMWYATGTAWVEVDGKPEGAFELRDAVSGDGITWERPNRRILVPERDDEVMCKPNVVYRNGAYHMWFSVRSYREFRGGAGSYRVGYARSADGETWDRDDASGGLSAGAEGAWDSDMVCFTSILELGDRLVLFYTGNGFGASGFGIADWTD